MIALVHTADSKHFKCVGCKDCSRWKENERSGIGTCEMLEARGMDGAAKVTGRDYFCGSIMLKKTGEQVF